MLNNVSVEQGADIVPLSEASAKMLRETYLKARAWAREHKRQRLIKEQELNIESEGGK